ncbi:MAG: hypothetical protein U9P36_03940 [Thermodesulfobacteriota bacterium]|nr:hypothetical protein [Thermodesulfobacteriota bacterium]
MDCFLCKNTGYVMIKGYQTDKQFKVNCPYCAEDKPETKEAGTPAKQSGTTCEYCSGAGEVTIEAQDGTPRTVTCGHCGGSGNDPVGSD